MVKFLKEKYGYERVIMVGDGSTDLAACPPAVSVAFYCFLRVPFLEVSFLRVPEGSFLRVLFLRVPFLPLSYRSPTSFLPLSYRCHS